MSKSLLKSCLALASAVVVFASVIRADGGHADHAGRPRSGREWSASVEPSSTGRRSRSSRPTCSGVIENVMGPQRNLILARLEGGPLADTGVIAGMSGSPVYVDGRLIGAVSYSLGSFSKEPIAGITPIDEMTDATALDAPRPAAARIHIEYPFTRESLDRGVPPGAQLEPVVRRSPGRRPAAARRSDIGGCRRVCGRRPCCGRLPRRSSCPGFRADVADTLGAAFRDQGFRADRRGGGRSAERGPDAVRRPAQAGRCHRRELRHRRPAARRHRHGDPHRRRSRLRVRASDVQPGPDRVPDDARLRLHGAPEPVLLDEALDHRRDHRHAAPGSGHGDRRPARSGAEAHSR